MSLNPNLAATLRPIAEATASAGFMYANPKSPIVRALEKDGYISLTGTVDPSNKEKVGYVATSAGLAAVNVVLPAPAIHHIEQIEQIESSIMHSAPQDIISNTATQVAKKARKPRAVRPAPTISYSSERITMPATGRAGRAPHVELYPFRKLEAPNDDGFDSFFIHATEHLPNPANQLASAVGSANKRFKLVNPPRAFKIRAVELDAQFKVAGARVLRVM